MGFLIAQARLGPGRIHHCMRAIGAAERALELMCDRADARETFGRPVSHNANIRDWIAEARIEIEMARLLVLKTAWLMDTVGNQHARIEIAAIKFAVPQAACASWTARSRSTAAAASPTTSRWRRCTRGCARCGWPTGPTRCTSSR